MFRAFLLALPLTFVVPVLPQPASAQERSRDCNQNSTGRNVARGVLGGLARRGLGRIGGPSIIAVPASTVLDAGIISLLDCREQAQAVEASNQAVRGGVGTTSTWTSETRPGVSGSSAATGEERLADGTHCMTVTDIIIVDGQETRAPKRMCRGPNQARYARV